MTFLKDFRGKLFLQELSVQGLQGASVDSIDIRLRERRVDVAITVPYLTTDGIFLI